MASSFKTPGVYVTEVPTFPPSVAQVETAIPAFIGYTETATEFTNNDLLNVPTKIASMLEFEQYFGSAPSSAVTSISLDGSNQVTGLSLVDNHYLYEALRLFYANGGGDCYIVSVGNYQASIGNGDGNTPGFLKGLNALRKVDEPTLLLAPDAPLMAQADVNTLYTAMLAQCAELQDRFSIFDLRKSSGSSDFQLKVQAFRDGIGMNNLKYGAAYGPWLKANLPRTVRYADFKGNIKLNGVSISLPALLGPSTPAGQLATRLDGLVADTTTIAAKATALKGVSTSMQARFDGQISNILAASDDTAAITALVNIAGLFLSTEDFLLDIISGSSDLVDANVGGLVPTLAAALTTPVTSMKTTLEKFVGDANEPDPDGPDANISVAGYSNGFTESVTGQYFGATGTAQVKIKAAVADMRVIWGSLGAMFEQVAATAESFEDTIETAAMETIPAMKNMVRAIASEALVLPPSAAMAGVYARIDGSRGVWKAPANVSLNNVIGVTELIDNREQEGLNVDVVAGKSINAIRPFTGKGIMVWGARTLAGNDNEWRYINVRRLFIMVEESVRKATDQFVFESNDANTWVRVKGLIDNFLTVQWRNGALAGAKPEQAFYVKIGLNQTMTADDVLNGYMNVEIGLAAVRPAEFIVLKFSHKMQEA